MEKVEIATAVPSLHSGCLAMTGKNMLLTQINKYLSH
jgi:hypothetical protein